MKHSRSVTAHGMKLVELNRLFQVEHGSKLDLNKMEQCAPGYGAVTFIGRSAERNGLAAFVRKLDNLQPFDSGLITVALGGSALSSFVQPRPFYTAQNIDVLTPLIEMSLDVKLYYCLCIEANRLRYSTYGREANRTLKNILVSALESLPPWIDGTEEKAISELCGELTALGKGII